MHGAISIVDSMNNLPSQVTFGQNIYLQLMSQIQDKIRQNVVSDVSYLLSNVIFLPFHQEIVTWDVIHIGIKGSLKIKILQLHITNQVLRICQIFNLHQKITYFSIQFPNIPKKSCHQVTNVLQALVINYLELFHLVKYI